MVINMKNKFHQISPLISILVTTKNEEFNLVKNLLSIKNQTYINTEIIVVDNISNDKTKEIAKTYTEKVYNIGPERSAQRNFSVEMAKGKYIIYLDADMMLQPNLITECIKQIQDLDALYISEIVMGESFLCKIRRFERSFYDATSIDCVRFIKRDSFIKVGGFSLSLTGPEDFDLDKKLKQAGYKFGLLKNSYINHDESNINLKNYLNKKSYYSKSFDKYKNKWGADDSDIKKQLGFYYRFVQVFTEQKKYKKIIAHPLLFIGVIYLRVRVGWRYIRRNRNGS